MHVPESEVTRQTAWVTFWVTFLRGYELVLKVTQRVEKERKEYFFSFSSLICWVTFKMGSYPRKKVTQKVTQAFRWVTFDPARSMEKSARRFLGVLRGAIPRNTVLHSAVK